MLPQDKHILQLSPLASKVHEQCIEILKSSYPSLSEKEINDKMSLIHLSAVDSFYSIFKQKCRDQYPKIDEEDIESMFIKFTETVFSMKLKIDESAKVDASARKIYEAQIQEASRLEKPFTEAQHTLEHEARGLEHTAPSQAKALQIKAQKEKEEHEKSELGIKIQEIRESAFITLAKATPKNLSHVLVEKGENFARIASTDAQTKLAEELANTFSRIFLPIGGFHPPPGTRGANLYSSPLGKEGAKATGNYLEGTAAGKIMDEMSEQVKALFFPLAYTDTPKGHQETAGFMLNWKAWSWLYIQDCIAEQDTPDINIFLSSEEISPTSVLWNIELQKFRLLQDEVQKKGGHLYFNIIKKEAKPILENMTSEIIALENTKRELEKKREETDSKVPNDTEEAGKLDAELERISQLIIDAAHRKEEFLKTCWEKVSLPNMKMKGSDSRLGNTMIIANQMKRKIISKRLHEINFLLRYPYRIKRIQSLLKENPTAKMRKHLEKSLKDLANQREEYLSNQMKQVTLNKKLDITAQKELSNDSLRKKRKYLQQQLAESIVKKISTSLTMRDVAPKTPVEPKKRYATRAQALSAFQEAQKKQPSKKNSVKRDLSNQEIRLLESHKKRSPSKNGSRPDSILLTPMSPTPSQKKITKKKSAITSRKHPSGKK